MKTIFQGQPCKVLSLYCFFDYINLGTFPPKIKRLKFNEK